MSKERQIRDIRDVFPGADVGDYDTGRELTPLKEKNEPEQHRVVESTTSGVFFGSRDTDITEDLRRRGNYSTRKKRRAPRPPVFIDIDVGFSEQGIYDAPSEDMELTPELSNMTTEAPISSQLSSDTQLSRDLGQTTSRNNPLFDDVERGGSITPSSSGIGTDDNSQCDSATTPVDTGVPTAPPRRPRTPPQRTPPPRPPPPAQHTPVDSGPAHSNGYHTQPSDPDDSFCEEEFTLEFDDEAEPISDDEADVLPDPENSRHQLYTEYHGDDYSQYMNEDEKVKKVKRRIKKRRDTKNPAEPAPPSTNLPTTGDTAKKGLKLRMGGLFSTTNSTSSNNGGNLHSFSFAETKIGTDITDRDLDTPQGTVSRRFEKNPNASGSAAVGSVRRRSASRWWSKDMLSAHNHSCHSDILLKPRRSSSITDLHHDAAATDSGSDAYSHLSDPTHSHAPTGYNSDSESAVAYKRHSDFESYRKDKMYGTKNRGSERSAAHVNLWRRLSKNIRRGSAEFYEPESNLTKNPLSSPQLGF